MKKVLLLVTPCVLFITAPYAQVSKGKTLLGGSIYFVKGSEEHTNALTNGPAEHTTVALGASAGKVVRDNLVFGLQGSYFSQNQDATNYSDKWKNKGFSSGVFLRKYVPLQKNFYFFGHSAAVYGTNKTDRSALSGQMIHKEKYWNTTVSLFPGLAYAVKRNFHIEAGLNDMIVLNYGQSKRESTDLATGNTSLTKQKGLSLSTNLGSTTGFSIGFRFLL
jgi:hypothetical protein